MSGQRRDAGHWQDVVAISQLAADYCAAANRLDAAVMGNFYTADGALAGITKLVGMGDGDLIGAKAIVDFYRPMFDAVDFLNQAPSVSGVRIDGDVAHATSAIVEHARLKDGTYLLYIGDYSDELRRTGEGWRYARRTLTVRSQSVVTEQLPG